MRNFAKRRKTCYGPGGAFGEKKTTGITPITGLHGRKGEKEEKKEEGGWDQGNDMNAVTILYLIRVIPVVILFPFLPRKITPSVGGLSG